MNSLEILQPDDWHIHLRDGESLETTVPAVARIFGRAIVMPNLEQPVTTTELAQAYRNRIFDHLQGIATFTPLMTIYLTDETESQDLLKGFKSGITHAAKLYPAHATTNSRHGVTDIRRLDAVFEAMSDTQMPLLIHGEVTHAAVDVFDREKKFIDDILKPLLSRHPDLKVVLEHITTREAVDFVRNQNGRIAATITPHHLMFNRNAMFQGGIRPHSYCLPVLKREEHRLALREAATSGEPTFFLGSDSAPHSIKSKESSCGCAGIYSSPFALEAYAQVFEEEGQLNRLEGFSSLFGARFYGLPVHGRRVRLRQEPQCIPESYALGNSKVIPMLAGQVLRWKAELA